MDFLFHYSSNTTYIVFTYRGRGNIYDISQAALRDQKGIKVPVRRIDSILIEHRLIYPASSLYFFEALAVGALAPPAAFVGVSVATFLALLAEAGARAALRGAPPFVYDHGKDR